MELPRPRHQCPVCDDVPRSDVVKILSISVGRPREVESRGKRVRTSIFKEPVAGSVRARTLNLDGDEQSDLSVHGGPDKAVYLYPSEHYAYWRAQLPDMDFPFGAFGENLTSEGLSETAVHIGDLVSIGTAEFVVTQPRLPCFKLGVRFGRLDMVRRFQQSGRSGFYLAVRREGVIAAGDEVHLVAGEQHGVSVADIVRLYTSHGREQALLRRAVALAALPESWRNHFRPLLQKSQG
jgi:MOSC domain-containing protein YiiM